MSKNMGGLQNILIQRIQAIRTELDLAGKLHVTLSLCMLEFSRNYIV